MGEIDPSTCIRRHQAFALATVRERDTSACISRHQAFALTRVEIGFKLHWEVDKCKAHRSDGRNTWPRCLPMTSASEL